MTDSPLRILWLGPNYRHRHNHGHELFADAVARIPQIEVVRYGPGIGPTSACELWDGEVDVPMLIRRFGPFDAVVVQHIRHSTWENLAEVDLPKIGIVVDYFPRNEAQKNNFFRCHVYDLLTFPERWMILRAHEYQSLGHIDPETRMKWLPFSVDNSVFHPLPLPVIYDATILYSDSSEYPHRKSVAGRVINLCVRNGKKSFVKLVLNNKEKIIHEDYVRLICQSKVMVTSNDMMGSVNMKHLEYASCATPMLTDYPEDFCEMGFVDKSNYFKYVECVDRNSEYSLESKLKEIWSMDWIKLMEVGLRASGLIMARHTTDIRAREFIRMIGGIIDGKSEEEQFR